MKKFLSFLVGCLISSTAFAGTVSVGAFISNNDVTIARLETQRTTFSNCLNGNIEGGINIKAGSLVTTDFSNAVSPVTRWSEAFNNFTYTGMLPATSASLTSDISSGTSYISGYRVVIGTTSHTYTASKDTYVYVNKGGFYNYDIVANGATAPSNYSSTTGDLLLAVVVTSGTAITSVTDSRTTGISLSSGSNIVPTDYRKELYVFQASSTTITVAPGIVEVNGTKVSKTSSTTLTITTASDWAGGASLQAINTTGYVVIDSSGNLKLTTTAPTHSNYSLSITAGTKRYATVSSTVYRYIGWFRMNGAGSGQIYPHGVSNLADGGVRNTVYFSTTANASGATTVSYDNTAFSNSEGDQYMSADFVPTNINNKLKIEVVFDGACNGAVDTAVGLFQDSTTNSLATAFYLNSGGGYSIPVFLYHSMRAATVSNTTFKVRAGGSIASTYMNSAAGTAKYAASIPSSIRIEEIEDQLTT